MSKRLIALTILFVMLFTACSETVDVSQQADTTEENAGIFDLPDASVPLGNGSNSEEIDTQDTEQVHSNDEPENTETHADTQAGNIEMPTPDEIESVGQSETSSVSEEMPTESTVEPLSSEPNDPTQAQPSETQEPAQTQAPTELPEPVTIEVDPEQLAALSLYALSMEFPDFELQGFYSNGSRTDGIYAMFVSNGENLTAHIYPIGNERNTPGTMDIYATEVGYAAFDFVNGVDDNYTEIPQEDYVEQLSALSGVSVFSH